MIGRLSNKISRTLEKSNENPTLETSKVIKNKKRKLDDSISSLDLEIKSKNEVSNEEGLKKKMKKVKRQSVDGLEMTPIQDKSKSKMKFKKEKDVKMKDNASKLTKKSDNSKSTPETALYNSKTVYIEGLPFTATDEMVIEFFEVTHSVGSVKEVRLPRWHDSGRLRGYGHVEFVKESSVDKALELTGKYLNDRYLKIEKPLPPKEIKADRSEVIVPPGGCNTIFVKNLPYDVDEEAFQKEFQVFGPINSIRLPRWGHTNQLKGFGYVVFKRPESAEIAVKKSKGLGQNGGSGVVLNNRTLVIDFETGAPKMSFERQVNLVRKMKQ